jgi:hypothetical protein
MLGYTDVPGNLLPLPPVALWYDLHDLANILYRKLGRQADAKKTVAAFPGGNDESVNRLKNANDGDGVHYSGQKPESITVGGIDAPTLAFFIQNKDLFSYLAGNLDTMGGLAAASETVGQDKILEQAAGARLNHMRGQTIKFAKGIFESLFWYEWTDPVRERTVEKPVSGTDISVKSVWSEETREGNFLDYNFDIDVFSMQDDTPSTKLQKIGQALDRFVFPVLDVLREQGGQIDFKVLLALVGKLANVPELQDIVTFGALPEGTPVQSGEASHPTKKPNDTTRNYVRTSRSGATRSGKDAALTQLLLGGNPQQSEVASIGKPSQ